jgi:drug/metabolite transporter (DMT)-like permease
MSRAYGPYIAALATALVYGLTLLGEPLTVEELVGMALILGGVAFGSGAVRMPRREPAPATPSP